MTYTQIWDYLHNQVSENSIRRDRDGAIIPFDPDNVDYQQYMEWLDEGNEPNPCEPPEGEDNGATSE